MSSVLRRSHTTLVNMIVYLPCAKPVVPPLVLCGPRALTYALICPCTCVCEHDVTCIYIQVPDYYNIIKDPLDLRDVKERLDKEFYRTPAIFLADLKRICTNCRRYNPKDSIYFTCANDIEALITDRLAKYLSDANSKGAGPDGSASST